MLRIISVALCVILASVTHAETKVLIRASVQSLDDDISYQQHGTSHQRFGNDSVALSQALISYETLLTDDWHFHTVVNAYSDGEEKRGFTQLYTKYRPLTSKLIKPEIKLGFFYPAMSIENTDVGWLSPHFLTNSAINSWIGEELRTAGAEFSIRRNGRQARSPWSWKLVGSVFKGNDTTGTLLSWRGFALHDRQSVHNDRINFPRIPGVVSETGINAPAWTDPFREIDTKVGFYVGGHLAHKRQSEVRYYYYDNQADPTMLDLDRIYAWKTAFHSLSMRHKFSNNLTVFGQALAGSTMMGKYIVDNDFYAAYVAATYTKGIHTFSGRIDWYQVIDNDTTMYDPNNSQGEAITLSYKRPLSSHITVNAELQSNRGRQANRLFWHNSEDYTENVAQLAVTFRY